MNLKSVAANLPVELLRTLVAVNKSGDLVEAAGTLGTAPAQVQAQVAKLEETLGVMVFERLSAGNVRLSDHGKIVSRYAERLLSINDRLSQQLHTPTTATKLRVGLPRWVLKEKLVEIAQRCGAEVGTNRLSLRCDSLEELVRDVSTRVLDVVALCSMTEPVGAMVTEWWEDMYWVKSPALKTSSPQACTDRELAGEHVGSPRRRSLGQGRHRLHGHVHRVGPLDPPCCGRGWAGCHGLAGTSIGHGRLRGGGLLPAGGAAHQEGNLHPRRYRLCGRRAGGADSGILPAAELVNSGQSPVGRTANGGGERKAVTRPRVPCRSRSHRGERCFRYSR